MFLYHLRVFFSFCFWWFSVVLGKSRNPRWPLFLKSCAIPRHMTSSRSAGDLKGNIFERTIHPPSLIVIPREARAEGPSVARLINLSGRRPALGSQAARIRAENIFIYIYIFF